MAKNWNLVDKLEEELSKYKPYTDKGFWVDEMDVDYIVCQVYSFIRITDIQCISIAKRISKFAKKNNLSINHIYVGPFYFPIDSKHLS